MLRLLAADETGRPRDETFTLGGPRSFFAARLYSARVQRRKRINFPELAARRYTREQSDPIGARKFVGGGSGSRGWGGVRRQVHRGGTWRVAATDRRRPVLTPEKPKNKLSGRCWKIDSPEFI